MKKAGKTYEPVTYEGAGHGFMRAGEEPDASRKQKGPRRGLDAVEGIVEENVISDRFRHAAIIDER